MKLYLGLTTPYSKDAIHCPLIEIIPRKVSLDHLDVFTHFIFTSKSAVRLFFEFGGEIQPSQICFSVGQVTTEHLGVETVFTAQQETAEGLIEMMRSHNLGQSFLFWPHAARSRPNIRNFLVKNNLKFEEKILYDTVTRFPDEIPDLNLFDEIIFTSPSTVDAFIEVFGSIPDDIQLSCIGPITESYLLAKKPIFIDN